MARTKRPPSPILAATCRPGTDAVARVESIRAALAARAADPYCAVAVLTSAIVASDGAIVIELAWLDRDRERRGEHRLQAAPRHDYDGWTGAPCGAGHGRMTRILASVLAALDAGAVAA